MSGSLGQSYDAEILGRGLNRIRREESPRAAAPPAHGKRAPPPGPRPSFPGPGPPDARMHRQGIESDSPRGSGPPPGARVPLPGSGPPPRVPGRSPRNPRRSSGPYAAGGQAGTRGGKEDGSHGFWSRRRGRAGVRGSARGPRRVQRRGGGGLRRRRRGRLDPGRGGTSRLPRRGGRRPLRRPAAGDARGPGPRGRRRGTVPCGRGLERTDPSAAPRRLPYRGRPAGVRVLSGRRGRVLPDLGTGTAAAVDGGPVRPRRPADPLTGRHGRDGSGTALPLAERHPGKPRRRPP